MMEKNEPGFEAKQAKLDQMVEDDEQLRKRILAYAMRVISKLRRDGEHNTSNHAEFLATICNECDVVYGLGSQLCLEWMLDFYMAMEFKRAYSRLYQIWEFLVQNGYRERNKLEYFNDSEAFFVDDERLICVFGKR